MASPAVDILQLDSFEGPNLYGPRPGVLLRLRCPEGASARLADMAKDAAQRAGVVIASLSVSARPEPSGMGELAELRFATPTPAPGALVAAFVAEALRAELAGDESWDSEGRLFELGKRRRAEALPVAAVQLRAEASARGVPSFVRADGRLQLGYGARGTSVAVARELGPGLLAPEAVGGGGEPAPVPWGRLGRIPLLAVSGGAGRAEAARRLAARRPGGALLEDAGFEDVRRALAAPQAEGVVAALRQGDVLRRGLPFEQCDGCAVLAPDPSPDPAEAARVAALPMLVTGAAGCAALDAADPQLAALARLAPCAAVLFALDEAALAPHRGRAAALVTARGGRAIAIAGGQEADIGALADGTAAELAALALEWGLSAANRQVTR